MIKKSLLITALFFYCSCNIFAQTYIGKKKEINIILKNVENFSKHVMAGDAAKIADAYTTDGKIFPNRKEIMEGTAALEKYWEPSPGYKTLYHKVTPTEIRIVKKTAYDYGYYEGESMNPEGEKSTWRGKYVIVWKKVGKEWKIYLDIWNGIDPPKK